MRPFSIKICGMRDPQNILSVSALKPDYMGFIFYHSSPRFVGDDFEIPAGLNAAIQRVGVFVNDTPEKIIQTAEKHGLSLIQLHGEEIVEDIVKLKDAGLKVIKVLRVSGPSDMDSLEGFQTVADYILFDTRGELQGGNAKTFNWSLLDGCNLQTPFFLSGGLTVENLSEACLLDHDALFALDLNSGVEHTPGIKDIDKIRSAMKIIKG